MQTVQKISTEEFALVEAEQFADLGGWELGQQSMDQNGLGIPVKDATTNINFSCSGNYR